MHRLRIGLLLVLSVWGCATPARTYVEPSLPSGAAATLTLVSNSGRTLAINDIDGHLVGLTNHSVSSQWKKPTVDIAPGAHTVECYLIDGQKPSAALRYRRISLLAVAGRRYEVSDAGQSIVLNDQQHAAAPSISDVAPIVVRLAPAPSPPALEPMSLQELYARVVARAREARGASAADYRIEAVHIAEQLFGPHDATVALARAAAYHAQGRDDAAEALYEQVFSALARSRGRFHPDVMAVAADLAAVYRARGQDALALILYQRVLAFQEKTWGRRDPRLWETVYPLAELAHAHGDYAKADALYQRARRLLNPTDPRATATLTNYARLLRDTGKLRQAEAVETQAAKRTALSTEMPDEQGVAR